MFLDEQERRELMEEDAQYLQVAYPGSVYYLRIVDYLNRGGSLQALIDSGVIDSKYIG